MKKLLFLLFVFSACNTGVSEQDKAYIKSQITLHNSTFGLQYKLDSLDRRTKLMTAYMNLGNTEAAANKYADSINKDIYPEKNMYNPNTDPHLTYEKFMSYCEKNKFKTPVEHARLLTTNK